LAYLPQISRAARDRSGAQAISFMTWGLFLFSNISAVAYALVNTQDWTMAAVFLGNAAGCAAILVIAGWKRSRHTAGCLSASGSLNPAISQICGRRTGPWTDLSGL